MFSASKRIFFAYNLAIALLAGYAWRLHTGQLDRSKRYENCLESHDIILKLLWGDVESEQRELKRRRESILDSVRDLRYEQAMRVSSICEKQLREIALLVRHLYPYGYKSGAGKGWNDADDTRSEAMLQRMAIIGDSLQLFCADKPRTLEVVKQHFSETHLARIADVIQHGTRAEKAVALSELRFGMITAAHQVMRILAEPVPKEKIAYMPVFNAKNKEVHVGDVFSGELFGMIYLPEADYRYIQINGIPLPVEKGVGKFSACYAAAGPQKLLAKISQVNTSAGRIDSHLEPFTLEIRP